MDKTGILEKIFFIDRIEITGGRREGKNKGRGIIIGKGKGRGSWVRKRGITHS